MRELPLGILAAKSVKALLFLFLWPFLMILFGSHCVFHMLIGYRKLRSVTTACVFEALCPGVHMLKISFRYWRNATSHILLFMTFLLSKHWWVFQNRKNDKLENLDVNKSNCIKKVNGERYLTYYYQMARSLKENIKLLCFILNKLFSKNKQFDIIGLSETSLFRRFSV